MGGITYAAGNGHGVQVVSPPAKPCRCFHWLAGVLSIWAKTVKTVGSKSSLHLASPFVLADAASYTVRGARLQSRISIRGSAPITEGHSDRRAATVAVVDQCGGIGGRGRLSSVITCGHWRVGHMAAAACLLCLCSTHHLYFAGASLPARCSPA